MSNDPVDKYRDLMADVYELAGLSRATSEAFAQRRGHTAAQWHVLSVVSDEAHTVPEIARRLGLTRQSVQRVVDDLIQAALVEHTVNPRHKRSRLVRITGAGAEITTELYEDSTRVRTEQISDVGVAADDLDRARHVLRQLISSFDLDTKGVG